MNFYIFSQDPTLAASYQADNCLNNGIKAATQTLVNVHKLCSNPDDDHPFKSWDIMHDGLQAYPAEISSWCLYSKANYRWMLSFLRQLHVEFETRDILNPKQEHHWKGMLKRLGSPPTELLDSEEIVNLPNQGTKTVAETVEKWRKYACENHIGFIYYSRVPPSWYHPHIIE